MDIVDVDLLTISMHTTNSLRLQIKNENKQMYMSLLEYKDNNIISSNVDIDEHLVVFPCRYNNEILLPRTKISHKSHLSSNINRSSYFHTSCMSCGMTCRGHIYLNSNEIRTFNVKCMMIKPENCAKREKKGREHEVID